MYVELLQKESKIVLNVINTHLFWNPQFEEVKYFETARLLEYILLNKNIKENGNLILCGDFNSLPKSNVFNLLMN